MCRVLQRTNCGDICDLASTLYKYDFRKGDLFVISWASEASLISSELIMCGGGGLCIIYQTHPGNTGIKHNTLQ